MGRQNPGCFGVDLNPQPGTYVLLLENDATASPVGKTSVQVGRWREIEFKAGYYLYVGSAFGPGGVRARVLRHCRSQKPKRWHIDYLRAVASPLGVWYTHDPIPREHAWAEILRGMDGMSPIRGFGCSDCRCESHLFHTLTAPDMAQFAQVAGVKMQSWTC